MKPSIMCPEHGKVELSENEYTEQLINPDVPWYCPKCNKESEWVDQDED